MILFTEKKRQNTELFLWKSTRGALWLALNIKTACFYPCRKININIVSEHISEPRSEDAALKSEGEIWMMEVKTNRGRCNFPWGKCLPSSHHPSPCTDECFQGCWLEHTMLSVLIIRFLTALLIVDHIPCLQPHYLLRCLDSWFASLADFSSICSTLLDGMHRLMNGGEDLWPLQQCLNTSGSNESRVKLQAITGMQSFTADIKYTPLEQKRVKNCCLTKK